MSRAKIQVPSLQLAAKPRRYFFRTVYWMNRRNLRFRIKLTVAVYKDRKLAYRNDMLVPTFYERRSEARAHIKKEIKERLGNSNFFISPRVDFDLVRYAQEASCNTYLRYRILEEEAPVALPPALPVPLLEPKSSS